MAARSLPVSVRASSAAARQAHFTGTLTPSKLPRLTQATAPSADGELQVELSIAKDPGSVSRIRGQIDGRVELICQRCLRPYILEISLPINLVLVSSEAEEARLLRDHEPLWIVDDTLELHKLVEDEVMLALPLIPRCEKSDCDEIVADYAP